MMSKKPRTKTTVVVALFTALVSAQTFAQTIYSVADCTELDALPSITTDSVVDFTASPVCIVYSRKISNSTHGGRDSDIPC